MSARTWLPPRECNVRVCHRRGQSTNASTQRSVYGKQRHTTQIGLVGVRVLSVLGDDLRYAARDLLAKVNVKELVGACAVPR